jgi:ribulose-5-phosphate 4-epimerase/fuculose-1-phosphate aldolase
MSATITNLGRRDAAPVGAREWATRVDLAAFYRLAAHWGWDDLIYNHISARAPDAPDQYLVNSYGLLFEEVCASNLVKADFEGRVISAPEGSPGYNVAVPALHGLILQHRPDLACVAHVHTPEGMAVAATEGGLLPISQTAMGLTGHIAYHDYDNISAPGEAEKLIADLGDKTVLILRHHGLVAMGRTIPEAFLNLYNLIYACKAQVAAMASGGRLTTPSRQVLDRPAGADASGWADRKGGPRDPDGCLEWQAALRMLDRRDASYRS